MLQLQRPLVFLDVEATGPNIYKDRIVEVGLLKVWPEGKREMWESLVNPQVPVSPEATAVHGIRNEDVAQAPLFSDLAQDILDFIQDCDLSGFNILRFDIPLLHEEFLRSGIHWEMGGVRIVDSMVIFHKMEERTLSAALQFYCGEKQKQAHRALADAEAAGRVLEAQLKKYPHLLCDLDFLAEFSTGTLPPDWEGKLEWGLDGEAYFCFGKHKGKSVRAAFLEEPSYYYWMMEKDFLLSTKEFITRIFFTLYPHKKPVT